MPDYTMRNKIRRLSVIVYLLSRRSYTYAKLTDKINYMMDEQFCKSSIEKDVKLLREEFDCPIERATNQVDSATGQKGLIINEKYDFGSKLIEWIEFFH